jgi:hypothetical protein
MYTFSLWSYFQNFPVNGDAFYDNYVSLFVFNIQNEVKTFFGVCGKVVSINLKSPKSDPTETSYKYGYVWIVWYKKHYLNQVHYPGFAGIQFNQHTSHQI